MQALVNHGSPVPIVDAVRKTFTGKTGCVVPIATNSWATSPHILLHRLPRRAAERPGESEHHAVDAGQTPGESRTGRDTGTPEPGLVGETGIAAAGQTFHQDQEAAEISRPTLGRGKSILQLRELRVRHRARQAQRPGDLARRTTGRSAGETPATFPAPAGPHRYLSALGGRRARAAPQPGAAPGPSQDLLQPGRRQRRSALRALQHEKHRLGAGLGGAARPPGRRRAS